jgi:arsenical pump membrane protein
MPASSVHSAIVGVVLVTVLALIITRPRGLHVAWPAGIGALIVLAAGLLSFSQLGHVFGDIWDACATLIALFLLSEALDSNGFFTWAALHLARQARGSGWRLYLVMLLLTTGITALLANDGAILMLTPIFARLMQRIYKRDTWLPFILAAGFFADALSAILIPSNLTNIIIADANTLSFLHFFLRMLLPMCAAFLAGGAAFALRFRHRIAARYDYLEIEEPVTALKSRSVFVWGWAALGMLLVGYVVGGEFHLPVSLVAGPVALLMVLVVKLNKLSDVIPLAVRAPWSILVYALGMFVIITAAYQSAVLTFITHPWQQSVMTHAGPGDVVFAGSLAALLSAAVNNLPATLVGVLVLRTVRQPGMLAIYAIVLGVDIGPKLTPFGSLATLLWLGSLKRNGIHISWGEFMRENWWVTLITLAAALAGLLITGLIVHP